MSNKYCQALVELRNKPAHELKEVGDQWRTPDNIFWGINTLFGPFVLDLFTDGDNAKCAAYYTAEDNALAHDWSERLAELKGAAFGNPPYSRASQHEGQYITGMRYIMKHASAMRDKGGRYVFLIKAATSEVWWPEDADHIAFIRGRIGFELPVWFIPKDEKQVPTGAFSLVLLLFLTRPGRDRQSATSGAMNLRHVVRRFWRRFASRRKNWSGRWRHDDVNSMPAAGAGYADFLSERTWLPANQSGGGNHAGIPFGECSGGASSRTGEKGVITIKRGVARGITLHTAKDDDSEAVGIIRALLAGEENARLRATHWLHERDLKV